MKKMRKPIIAVLIMLVLFTCSRKVDAAVTEHENSAQPRAVTIHPITGDQYSNAAFIDKDAAHGYFGWEWEFHPCYEEYLGNYYNYYYYYEDGTKQFFYIIYSDDDVILNIPKEEYAK